MKMAHGQLPGFHQSPDRNRQQSCRGTNLKRTLMVLPFLGIVTGHCMECTSPHGPRMSLAQENEMTTDLLAQKLEAPPWIEGKDGEEQVSRYLHHCDELLQGKNQEAIRQILRAGLSKKPEDPFLRFLYGVTWYQCGNYLQAKEQFDLVIRMENSKYRREQYHQLVVPLIRKIWKHRPTFEREGKSRFFQTNPSAPDKSLAWARGMYGAFRLFPELGAEYPQALTQAITLYKQNLEDLTRVDSGKLGPWLEWAYLLHLAGCKEKAARIYQEAFNHVEDSIEDGEVSLRLDSINGDTFPHLLDFLLFGNFDGKEIPKHLTKDSLFQEVWKRKKEIPSFRKKFENASTEKERREIAMSFLGWNSPSLFSPEMVDILTMSPFRVGALLQKFLDLGGK